LNLSDTGKNTTVNGKLIVKEDMDVQGTITFTGTQEIVGDLFIKGNTTLGD